MRKFGPLICTLAAALMFYLSQGTSDVWWQAWFAPLPILWLAYGPARNTIVAAAAFFAFALGQLYMVQMYIGQMPVSFMAAWVLIFGVLFTAAILAARLAQRQLPPYAALFAFPVFWTAIEYLVSLVSPHGTFGAIAYSQVSFPPALQIASLFGLYAITFVLSLFANALALFARGHKGPAALGIALAAASLIFGVARLSEPEAVAPMRVAALSDQVAARASRRADTLAASQQMTAEYVTAASAAAAKGARIIVTPETGILLRPAWSTAIATPLSAFAKSSDATLVIGTMGLTPERNIAMSYAPDGVHQYDKRHLLYPFEGKFTPGPGPGLLGQGRAVAICKDMDFPATLRADALSAETANNGIRIMAVPANDFIADGWIHARMAVLRGVVNGFAIVRSATQGLETVSDAQGRVIARANTNAPGLTEIIADVPPGPGPTLYTRIGDIFCWLMLLASAALLALSFRSKA
jgi:apolipoprotein N-acyltransferase